MNNKFKCSKIKRPVCYIVWIRNNLLFIMRKMNEFQYKSSNYNWISKENKKYSNYGFIISSNIPL